MKFSFDKEWLERHADSDQNLEIAAGWFSLDQGISRGLEIELPPPALKNFKFRYPKRVDMS